MELKEYEITASVKMAVYGVCDKAIHHIITSSISEALGKERIRANFITGQEVAITIKEVSSR